MGILEEIQKFVKSFQCEPEHFNSRIIFMSMFDVIMRGENDNTEECAQNPIEVSKYAPRFPCGRWSFLGPRLEKTWYKTCSDKPNREWDRTAAMIVLQLVTESDHPVSRASSVFERGKLDITEYGKKSTRFDDNEGNIEMLLCTVISVNQLSVYGCLADWCKKWDNNSSEESAPSSEGSESSRTLYAKEVIEMRRFSESVCDA